MSDDHIVKAIAVSRPPCPDCSVALAEYGKDHGRVLVQVVPPPTEEEQRQRQAAKTAVQAAADRVVSQVDSYERDHQSQWDLIYDPSVTGFAGYWTNHLFQRAAGTDNEGGGDAAEAANCFHGGLLQVFAERSARHLRPSQHTLGTTAASPTGWLKRSHPPTRLGREAYWTRTPSGRLVTWLSHCSSWW